MSFSQGSALSIIKNSGYNKQDGQGSLEAGKPGRRLRDASGLNEGSDWDRL